MTIHDEFSGTLTLTENSSKELFRVLKEQDEAFISDVFDGKCGFTLRSADGRSVELVPKADRKTEPTISKMEQVEWTKEDCKGCKYNEYPYDSGTCFVRVCINGNKYEPKDEPTGYNLSPVEDEQQAETKTETKNSNLTFEKQTDCPWK